MIATIDEITKFRNDLNRLHDLGMSAADIARPLGVHRSSVIRWLSGERADWSSAKPHHLTVKGLRPLIDQMLREKGLEP